MKNWASWLRMRPGSKSHFAGSRTPGQIGNRAAKTRKRRKASRAWLAIRRSKLLRTNFSSPAEAKKAEPGGRSPGLAECAAKAYRIQGAVILYRSVERKASGLAPKIKQAVQRKATSILFRESKLARGCEERCVSGKSCRLHFDVSLAAIGTEGKYVESKSVALGLGDVLYLLRKVCLARGPKFVLLEFHDQFLAGSSK